MQPLTLEVVASIQRILELQNEPDTLESLGTLDHVKVLNALLPDESALGELESIQARLIEDQTKIQVELDGLQAELQSDQDPDRMQIIQELISELLSQMNRIREKATESEAIVRNITKDIQTLDLAKKNILHSVTTLKRFQMLVNAIGQLEAQIRVKHYADISQTLLAVKEVAALFKQYTAVERIAVVWRRVQELQGTLRSLIEEDFDAFFLHDAAKAVKLSTLSDACLVVDVLGDDFRNQITDRYCSIELKEYRRIFRATDEAGQLDNLSRRYAWFRRVLNGYDDEHSSVFPAPWKVGEHLCAKFAEITRDDMVAMLNKAAPTLTVALLLDALRQTTEFEQSMGKKFDASFEEMIHFSSVRQVKTISSAFDAHMGVFVDAQDKALADMMSSYRGVKSRTSLENNGDESESLVTVLPSSTELFFFYAQNLDQCAKLSNKGPLFDLAVLHKKWLRIYAEDVLMASMKRSERERKSMENRINTGELRNGCLLLNTAEYCQVTALELEEKLKGQISEEYREKVTFQPERDLFISAISSSILVLLRELEIACEPHFTAMGRTPWNQAENVSSQSAYMTDLVATTISVVDVVRDQVEKKKYLRNFYDKAASLLTTRFTNTLVKSKPIKEIGAEQILLDLQALKATLLKLPGTSSSEGSLMTSYTRTVNTSTTRLETLLKVIIAPINPPDAFVLNYTLLVGDSSFSNFQKILDLKGTSRVEQNTLLDTFLSITSTKDDLEANSFLSSLDMDPSSQIQAQALSNSAPLPALLDSRALFGGLSSPPPVEAKSPIPGISSGTGAPTEKREVFSDFKRFVTFAVRRDREQRMS